MNFNSICVHDVDAKNNARAQQLPIYASSSFYFDDIQQGIDIFAGKEQGYVYARYGNPTVSSIAQKIAQLETYGLNVQAESVMVSSGMAAVTTLVMGILKSGDNILTQGNLYGGVTELFNTTIANMGISTTLLDLKDLASVEEHLQKNPSTKLLYFETPANPTLACVDIEALSNLAKKYGIWTAVDNTFCTPYLQQPFQFGVDFIVHSTTKYLNGHGNSVAGIVIGKSPDLMKNVWNAMKLLGTNCNAFDAWLTNIGIKTLPLRMDKHSQNAMQLAHFLAEHPKVERVNYVGLASHPDHALARKQMKQAGGMLSFELKGGFETGVQFMNNVKFCSLAPTLGDVETLILHPASSSHLRVPPAVRLQNGITDGLIRLSVGIEDVADIQRDLETALQGL